jgi:ABC-type multidrug transport system ATPase subunit
LLEDLADTVNVVVSTHQTEDLADSYRHVVVLDRGAIRFQGTPEEFHGLADGSDSPRERAEAAYARLVGQEV